MNYRNRGTADGCGSCPKRGCTECLNGADESVLSSLTDYINAKCHNVCVYKKLADCAPDRESAACLRTIANEEECHSRNLQAAYFIITGERVCLDCQCAELDKCFCCELREAFGHERELTCEFAKSAACTGDSCLAAVYSAISEADARHARELFRIIERVCTSSCRCGVRMCCCCCG